MKQFEGPLTMAKLQAAMGSDEHANLEFKRSLLSRSDIGNYAVGIGNAGGGWLILGVTDQRPRQLSAMTRPTNVELQKIREAVLDRTGVPVTLHELATDDGFVLGIEIPGRPRGGLYSTRDGRFLIRCGEALRGISPEEIFRIREREMAYVDFLAGSTGMPWRDALDPTEIERLREILTQHGVSALAEMGDGPLLRSLGLIGPRPGQDNATRAAVLLLGREDTIREHIPLHEAKLQLYKTDELSPAYSTDSSEPMLALVERLEELIEQANTTHSIEVGMFRVDVPRYPRRAYREAIANALIHRDYEAPGNLAVRLYSDRLEVANPGGWFGGVSETNILVTESRRRNELLASALQRIGLAERSSLGVKRMFSSMLAAGKKPPVFRAAESSITVTLSDGSFDEEFVSFVATCRKQDLPLTVFDLLILSALRSSEELQTRQFQTLCQQASLDATRELLNKTAQKGLLDRRGKGRGTTYALSPKACEWLSMPARRHDEARLAMRGFEVRLIEELERVKERGLTPAEMRTIIHPPFGRQKLTQVLRSLHQTDAIMFSGKRGRGSRYWLPLYAPIELYMRPQEKNVSSTDDVN